MQIEGNSVTSIIERSKNITYFVATEKNKIIGICGYDTQKIYTLFVDVRYHKKGIGKKLLAKVLYEAKNEGIKVGLIRPITLWPFPVEAFVKYVDTPEAFLTIELSAGQMVEDVRLAVNGIRPVHFYGRMGGMIPTQDEIFDKIKSIL